MHMHKSHRDNYRPLAIIFTDNPTIHRITMPIAFSKIKLAIFQFALLT